MVSHRYPVTGNRAGYGDTTIFHADAMLIEINAHHGLKTRIIGPEYVLACEIFHWRYHTGQDAHSCRLHLLLKHTLSFFYCSAKVKISLCHTVNSWGITTTAIRLTAYKYRSSSQNYFLVSAPIAAMPSGRLCKIGIRPRVRKRLCSTRVPERCCCCRSPR